MNFKSAIKKYGSNFSHRVGFFSFLSFCKGRNKAFVLTYHRVLHSQLDEPLFVQPGMYVSVDTFRKHATFLKERFLVLPLAELVERLATGRSVNGSCAITFDDGWHDNYTHAFPVLNEFQLPATVFLATGFIGTDRLFWPEELTFYLRQSGDSASDSQHQLLDRFISKLAINDSEETFLDNAILALKTCPPHDRNEILDHLRSFCTISPPDRLMMNWEEAKEMQASGLISIGAHTANHVILDQVSQRQAEEEINRSLHEVVYHLGVRPEFFAYPNGNFNKDLQSILKCSGFRGAVTTRKGWVGKGVPLYEIPRIGMHEDVSRTIPLFLARILLKRF